MEGQGDLVSGLIMGVSRVTIWVLEVINLLTKSPDPPSILSRLRVLGLRNVQFRAAGFQGLGLSLSPKRVQNS